MASHLRSSDSADRTLASAGIELRDLGSHHFKDLTHPERISRVMIAGVPSDFPALRSMDVRPNNLPLQLTSLVGRTDEIATTSRHWSVTDWSRSPGRAGPARPGWRWRWRRLLHRFQDGVYLVELAAVSDPAQVPSVVAQALGVKEGPGRSLSDAWSIGSPTRRRWWSSITSSNCSRRHRLSSGFSGRLGAQVTGDQPGVPPVVRRARVAGATATAGDPDDDANVLRSEAAAFVERAQAIKPALDLRQDAVKPSPNSAPGSMACPLAIELAARRVNILSAILARLSTGLDMLDASGTNLPLRQQTLRATINGATTS